MVVERCRMLPLAIRQFVKLWPAQHLHHTAACREGRISSNDKVGVQVAHPGLEIELPTNGAVMHRGTEIVAMSSSNCTIKQEDTSHSTLALFTRVAQLLKLLIASTLTRKGLAIHESDQPIAIAGDCRVSSFSNLGQRFRCSG